LATVLLLGFSAALLLADDKVPSVETIMGTHHEKDATLDQIKAAVGKDKPDWDKVQELTKSYSKDISQLGKNEAPKADKKELWKELTKKIGESAKDLDEKAKKKDKEGVTKVLSNLKPSQCSKCHGEFRD
jgi:hypothetical protein